MGNLNNKKRQRKKNLERTGHTNKTPCTGNAWHSFKNYTEESSAHSVPNRTDIVTHMRQIVPTIGGGEGVNFKPLLVIFHAAQRQKQRNAVGSSNNDQPSMMGIAAAVAHLPRRT